MSKDDGGPAFPFPGEPGVHGGNSGMSLRDYFAAHAPITLDDAVQYMGGLVDISSDSGRATVIAVLVMMRAEYAEAMLNAR